MVDIYAVRFLYFGLTYNFSFQSEKYKQEVMYFKETLFLSKVLRETVL